VLVGGVSAADHHVSIAAVLVSASLGAVIGDQIGYFVGRRWGMQLLRKLPDRLLDEEKLEAARAYVRRLGAKAVVLGRWTAALRALVPGLAGVSQMPYARFLVANVIGGVLWACTCGIVGYVAGDNWHSVQHTIGSASYVLLGVIVVGLLGWHFWRRRQEKRKAAEAHDA
jgi:undecaprenyl-diphosphatase